MIADLSAERTYHIDYLAEISDPFCWTAESTSMGGKERGKQTMAINVNYRLK